MPSDPDPSFPFQTASSFLLAGFTLLGVREVTKGGGTGTAEENAAEARVSRRDEGRHRGRAGEEGGALHCACVGMGVTGCK